MLAVREPLVARPAWKAELALTFAIEQKVPVTVLPCLLKSLPALGGVIMLIRGRAIAEWMDNLLDN